MDKLPSELTDLIMQYAGPRATLSLASTSRSNKAAFNASKSVLTKQFFQFRVIEERYDNIRELYDSQWWNILRLDTLFTPFSLTDQVSAVQLRITGTVNTQDVNRPLLNGIIDVALLYLSEDIPFSYRRKCVFKRGKLNGLCRDYTGEAVDHVDSTVTDMYNINYIYDVSLLQFQNGKMERMQLRTSTGTGYTLICLYKDDILVHAVRLTHQVEPDEIDDMQLSADLEDPEPINTFLSNLYDSFYNRIFDTNVPSIDKGTFLFRNYGHLFTIDFTHQTTSVSKIYSSLAADENNKFIAFEESWNEVLSPFEFELPYIFYLPSRRTGSPRSLRALRIADEHNIQNEANNPYTLSMRRLIRENGYSRRRSRENEEEYGEIKVQIIPAISVEYIDDGGEVGYLLSAVNVYGFEPVLSISNPYQIEYEGERKELLELIRDTFVPLRV